MGRVRNFRDLDVWQRAVDLSVAIYHVTGEFPKSELYGMTSQMRRSAVSIASNIAEGFGRSNKDFARFLTIAQGSQAELYTQLEIAKRVNLITEGQWNELTQTCTIIAKQINALKSRLTTNHPPSAN